MAVVKVDFAWPFSILQDAIAKVTDVSEPEQRLLAGDKELREEDCLSVGAMLDGRPLE
eukprot:CAMPEP_0197934166 /NCGR_PEP_ID=MMETSP1439-20131203/111332_1 /TAXON_ID=66791 /ORGANISM="Gonyaulax spinifera, Strain CCMP409" /LENGTH=57 /DNA_ID=CAMNT_0043557043 /DNA_START=40 /DNA_END=210 /DNA_ORIENTATION=+